MSDTNAIIYRCTLSNMTIATGGKAAGRRRVSFNYSTSRSGADLQPHIAVISDVIAGAAAAAADVRR